MQKKLLIILATISLVGMASAYGTIVGLYTDSSGNVGIGTTNPSQKLTVISTGSNTVLLNSTNSTGPGLTLYGALPFKIRSTNTGDPDGSLKFAITNSSSGLNMYTIDYYGHTFIAKPNARSTVTFQSSINNPNAPTNGIISDVWSRSKNNGGNLSYFSLIETIGDNFTQGHEEGRLRFYGSHNGQFSNPLLELNVGGDNKTHINTGAVITTGNAVINNGANIVYRCTAAGILPIGTLTTNSANCGTFVDTGLRVP